MPNVRTHADNGGGEVTNWQNLADVFYGWTLRRIFTLCKHLWKHMWKILHGQTSNDLNVQFVSRPRLGTLAIIPSKSRTSSAANQTLFDNSFAVQGPKLWNAMPHNLNNIQSLEHFKDQLTKFLLSFPDMPPIRGCSPPNSNSLLSWRIERGYTSLWGGRNC